MSAKKVITVFGATGAQGGGLVRAICEDKNGEFSARAVTRDINSDKAKALAAAGAELVQGDLSDPASVHQALQGAYGAFFVTFFWEHFSPERESAEAALFAEASKKAGLQHAIWSTLEDTRKFIPLDDERMPTLMEKYKVPHLDAKGESNQFFKDADVPTTFLHTSFYWDNYIYFGLGPKRDEDGKLSITLPIGDAKMAGIAAEDIGKCALGIFKAGDNYINKEIGIAGEHLTGKEMAEGMGKAMGETVTYNKIPAAVFRSFGFPGADDLGNMFQFFDEFNVELNNKRDISLSRKLNPDLLSYQEWLTRNAKKIPVQ